MSPGPPRRSARKAAAAAGALFAAGAVFSGTVVDTVRTPRGAVDFASDPGPSTGSGTLDRTRSPQPGRAGQPITLTAVAQLFTPATTAAIEYGPPASGTQIGRDAFGAPDDRGAGLVAVPELDKTPLDRSPLPAGATAAVPGLLDIATSPAAEPPAEPSVLTVATPEFQVPAIEVPRHVLNLPGGGTVRTPGVAVSEGRVTPPRLNVARNRDGGLDVAVSDGAVVAPKVEASGLADLTGGAVRLSPTRVGLPDVRISGGGVVGTTAAAPDMRLSEIRSVLPDVDVAERTPETDATAQRRASERNENKKSARDAARSVGSAVGRLLGRH
ncbi:hypothetical protein ACQPWY_12465 [Pseudonocardia xinjiangensis]|uniref:hypothetical protein n=1 Tax=Pseudonocardia xinjiangensis TaxID=75289 RepID=UPI003D93D316